MRSREVGVTLRYLDVRVSVQKEDASSGIGTHRTLQVVAVKNLNPSALEKRNQTLDVVAGVALDLPHGGKLDAVGLRDVEDVCGVGGSDVPKLLADKFHRDMPEDFSAEGARDGFASPQKPKLARSTVSSPRR